jgi:asparagine synthase (glutamine-hydrolysing)
VCGVVGIINFNQQKVDKNKLIYMNDILAHRGPDYGDVYIDNNIGLGHRRLSIIDLSSEANQPFQYQDSEYYIVYNGEVYNYLELRKELEKRGYSFRTTSDTEVVLASYIEWKEECFHKFNGMWSLAIYNIKSKELILCRDRYGVKPLYYYKDENKFLFASEKKAIILSDFVELKFDKKGIKTALKSPFDLEASGYTEFENVYNLLPGHMIKIKSDKVLLKRWYSLKDNISKNIPDTFEKRIEMFQELFENACILRLRSDVPIATSLSGGLDSSSIVAMLSKIDNSMHQTFVHSFKGTDLDETAFASIVAETTNTPMNTIKIDAEDISQNIDDIIYYFESIYGGMPDSAYRIYKAQKEQGFKISIDGHGADEMLGGYSWYLDELKKDTSFFNFQKKHEIREHKDEITLSKKFNNKESFIKYIFNKLPISFQKKIKDLVKQGNSNDYYTCLPPPLPNSWSFLKKKLYNDFSYTILPRILKNFDAMSMANSIEVRMPFLDYRLVEYVFSLPNDDLINKKWTKYILRKSMDDILDKRVNWRKDKIGFNSPVAEMMKNELKEWVENSIKSIEENEFGIDKEELKKEFKIKNLNNMNFGESLAFWKKINTVKLIKIYKERKNA